MRRAVTEGVEVVGAVAVAGVAKGVEETKNRNWRGTIKSSVSLVRERNR